MDKLFQKKSFISTALSGLLLSTSAHSFELLSEGAMGTVSAVSVESVEDIINVAGSTAAGLRADTDYELLPYQANATVGDVLISVGDANPDEVTNELEFALTQEVETWAQNLNAQTGVNELAPGADVGYVDELPPSAFDDAVFLIRDDEFDSIVFESDSDQEEDTSYELGRIDQTFRALESNLDSITFVVKREVEYAATIDAYIDDPDTPSVGSGYISNLSSISNVHIATVRD